MKSKLESIKILAEEDIFLGTAWDYFISMGDFNRCVTRQSQELHYQWNDKKHRHVFDLLRYVVKRNIALAHYYNLSDAVIQNAMKEIVLPRGSAYQYYRSLESYRVSLQELKDYPRLCLQKEAVTLSRGWETHPHKHIIDILVYIMGIQ